MVDFLGEAEALAEVVPLASGKLSAKNPFNLTVDFGLQDTLGGLFY